MYDDRYVKRKTEPTNKQYTCIYIYILNFAGTQRVCRDVRGEYFLENLVIQYYLENLVLQYYLEVLELRYCLLYTSDAADE